MSEFYQSLSHSKWDCKYHVVFVSRYRRQAMFLEIRKFLGPVFHELARQKECRIVEGHLLPDHVHITFCCLCDWIAQRQKCHCHCASISGQAT